MGNIPQIYTRKIIDVATASVSAVTSTTGIFDMSEATNVALQFEWGVNVTGTFTFYERNDPTATWLQNLEFEFKNPAKSSDDNVIELYDMNSVEYALRFTRTSGTTGPIEVWANVKGY